MRERIFSLLLVAALAITCASRPAHPVATLREAPSSVAWHLAFEDLFPYADQTAFAAAYAPGLFNATSGVRNCTYGATNGPSGGPGCEAVWDGIHTEVGTGDQVTGELQKPIFGLQGREYRITGLINNATNYLTIECYWIDPVSYGNDDTSSRILMVASGKEVSGSNYGDLIIQYFDSNVAYPHIVQTIVPGALPTNVAQTIDVQFKMSNVGDGYLKVLVGGVEQYSAAGINIYETALNNDSIPYGSLGLNYVQFEPGGKLGEFRIYDTLSVTPPVMPKPGSQIDNSTPCCGSHAGGTSTGPIGIPIAPFVNKRSPGGGIVPTAADVVEAEDWADEFPPKEPDIIVTIKGLESIGEPDEHWGFKPMSDRGRHVAARIIDISTIERASTDKDGRFTPARARIVVLDDDGTMRERLGDEDRRELINREARIDIYSYAGRKAGLAGFPLMQGRIVDVQPMLDRKSLIEIQDVVGAQCGLLDPQKLIGLVVGDEHPGKPEESKGRIYNVLLGESTDSGRRDATGASASVGTMPVVDCGDEFISGTPDPEGRTFNDALTAVDDAADVNLTGTGGTIDYPTRVFVAPIIGGEIGPFSDVPTGFLDPDGDGAGNPSVPHAHRKVWMDIAGGADEYLTVFTKVPGFHPVTNATVDLNARYQVVSGTPSMPAFPPRNGGIGPQWDFFVDYLDDADGSQWGVQTVGPPTNLVATVIGTPGTARKSYSVASVSIFGESAPCTPVLVTTAPDVLSATDYVHLTWGPPVDNAASVIGYRVLMTEAA